MSTPKKIVVIGNGMVGHRFCEKLTEFDAAHRYRIVTFCEEPRAAYDRVGLTSRPVRELKSFERVTLRPGERKTLNFTVKANDLGSYDPQMRWVVNPGTYDVWVAPDSASGVQGSFQVK